MLELRGLLQVAVYLENCALCTVIKRKSFAARAFKNKSEG